ncbi:MAG: hypothetical protein PVI23_12380 [Maricaulaceae bacterium]|jgi:hypothetical protein
MSRTLVGLAAFALAAVASGAASAKFEAAYSGAPLPAIGTLNITMDEEIVGEDRLAARFRFARTEMIDPADAEDLIERLRAELEDTLSRTGAYTPMDAAPLATLNVTITKASSSNPGFTRNGFRQNVSAAGSTGRGGATIEAQLLQPDGSPIADFSFDWDESQFDLQFQRSAWQGAHRAFDRFARQLAEELD